VKGLLFSAASMATLVMTPMTSSITAKLGKQVSCAFGIILFTAAFSTFGSAGIIASCLSGSSYIEDDPSKAPVLELTLLFLARILGSSGGTLASMSAMAMALEANPSSSGMIMGSSETALGIGFSVGPSVGAAFFTWGGFTAPFIAVSMMTLGLLPLVCLAAPRSLPKESSRSSGDLGQQRMSPWHSPSAISVAVLAAGAMFGFGFLDPTLAPFEVDLLGTNTAGAGVLFSCSAFPYAILGTVVGAILDASPSLGAPMICIGGFCMGLSLFILAPMAPFMATWAWQISVLLGLGLFTAAGMVPAVPQILAITKLEAARSGRRAPSEEQVLSFTWTSFTLGEMLGPLVGGYAANAIGFSTSVHIIGCALGGLALIAFVVLSSNGHIGKGAEGEQETLLPEESEELHGMDMPRALQLARQVSRGLD